MKINFLNDESHKFDESSNDDFFEENTVQQPDFQDDPFNESILDENISDTSIPDDFDDEFGSATPTPTKKPKFVEEHDIISDESSTHRKIRLASLSVVIILTLLYFSLDYINLDSLLSQSEPEPQKEYIETIIPDSSTKKNIVVTEKPQVKPTKKKVIEPKTKRITTSTQISQEILDKSSERMNLMNTVKNITSFSFVSAKLQQIYVLNKDIFFEVFSNNRNKLGTFSKALSNQIKQVKLTNSKSFNSNGVSATFKFPPPQSSTADFGDLQKPNTVINILKQSARNNNISLVETSIEKSFSKSKTPIFIRAKGPLKSMSNFVDIINNSLNNVSLSKFSLASTSQKKTTGNEFLLSMRITVLK